MIKYMEICKQNGKGMKENIEEGLCNIWDSQRIKGAFNFGEGTEEDFKRYMIDNKDYAYFKKLIY